MIKFWSHLSVLYFKWIENIPIDSRSGEPPGKERLWTKTAKYQIARCLEQYVLLVSNVCVGGTGALLHVRLARSLYPLIPSISD